MTALVFDIETDGLFPTKIWCMSTFNVDTQEHKSFGPSELYEGLATLKSAEKLIGHNILNFDMPVIKKLTGLDLTNKYIVDTLVLSRLFKPTREGGHGLESWGYRLRCPKIEFDDYFKYSDEMLKYCAQDVLVNYKVYQALKRESRGFKIDCVNLEHEAAVIIDAQIKYGFLLDQDKASDLLEKLSGEKDTLYTAIHAELGQETVAYRVYPTYLKSSGKLSKMGEKIFQDGTIARVKLTAEQFEFLSSEEATGHIDVTEPVDFNISSRQQVATKLVGLGWKPEKFTPTGQPCVDEGNLGRIKGIPVALKISRYLKLESRIAEILGWFKVLDTDTGRVHGWVNPNGTVTGRMTHSKPNMANIPRPPKEFGKEFRGCWTIPKGYKLVGIDASSLELRMLAHYLNDKEYINEIVNGDIHTTNQQLAGLESRDQAKTFIYAFLYGAGDAKLGSVVGGGKGIGRTLKQSFLNNLPSLRTLKNSITRKAAKANFLRALDGRKLFIRSEHSALNMLLQGAGAIVMKKALIIFNNKLQGMDANFVVNVHDEFQVEVREDLAETVGKLGVESIIAAGVELKLNCPLDGEYRIGDNWSETH
jgi:DNA polymerase I-like protein with 3'-5' exonuclease and polymerase domains